MALHWRSHTREKRCHSFFCQEKLNNTTCVLTKQGAVAAGETYFLLWGGGVSWLTWMPNKGASVEDFMLRQKEHVQQEIGLSNHMLSCVLLDMWNSGGTLKKMQVWCRCAYGADHHYNNVVCASDTCVFLWWNYSFIDMCATCSRSWKDAQRDVWSKMP
jgi:hypothetical protein